MRPNIKLIKGNIHQAQYTPSRATGIAAPNNPQKAAVKNMNPHNNGYVAVLRLSVSPKYSKTIKNGTRVAITVEVIRPPDHSVVGY